MIIPELQGNFNQSAFFIYVACDSRYFDEFAVNLLNSIEKNSKQSIHIHIFNPRDDQLKKISNRSNISFTYEFVKLENFIPATTNLEKISKDLNEKFKIDRSLNAMQKSQDFSLTERLIKTYFACARFIRLRQLINRPQKVFAIDIDAIVRKPIIILENNFDFYIHHITGRKARFLAGGMFLLDNARSLKFLNEYADTLEQHISSDHLYWSLDQDVLDSVVPKFNYGQLPLSYIDWNMQSDSAVWTAKGERKRLPAFVSEKSQYNS